MSDEAPLPSALGGLAELKETLRQSAADIDDGRLIDSAVVEAELRARLARMQSSAEAGSLPASA